MCIIELHDQNLTGGNRCSKVDWKHSALAPRKHHREALVIPKQSYFARSRHSKVNILSPVKTGKVLRVLCWQESRVLKEKGMTFLRGRRTSGAKHGKRYIYILVLMLVER